MITSENTQKSWQIMCFIQVYYCKCLGEKKVASVIVNKVTFELFVRDLLLVKHYRVEVYKNKGGKQNNEWSLAYKVSH